MAVLTWHFDIENRKYKFFGLKTSRTRIRKEEPKELKNQNRTESEQAALILETHIRYQIVVTTSHNDIAL